MPVTSPLIDGKLVSNFWIKTINECSVHAKKREILSQAASEIVRQYVGSEINEDQARQLIHEIGRNCLIPDTDIRNVIVMAFDPKARLRLVERVSPSGEVEYEQIDDNGQAHRVDPPRVDPTQAKTQNKTK